jgi:hypothetical protein
MGINEPTDRWLIILFESFWRANLVDVASWRLGRNILGLLIILLCYVKHKVNLVLEVVADWLVTFIVKINLNESVGLRLRSMKKTKIIVVVKTRSIVIFIIILVNR